MTVENCLKAYRALGERAFTPKLRLPFPGPPKGAYSTKALKAAIQQAIMENCQEYRCEATQRFSHADDIFQDASCTRTYAVGSPSGPPLQASSAFADQNRIVLAATKQDLSARPTLFRTYDSSSEFRDCSICEVAMATSAATTFFKSVKMGPNGIDFVDAALGYNNPSEVLIQEAHRLFPRNQDLCLLSIGTGLGGTVSIRDTRTSILRMLKRIGTESNKVADRLQDKYDGTDQYFRFNVDRGLEDVTLADWRMDSDISAYTHNYLKGKRAEMLRFVSSLDIDTSTTKMQTAGCAHTAAEKGAQRKTEVTALDELCINCNSSDLNSEQTNRIAKVQPGRKATIADNVARDGSKQWNLISA